MLAAVGQAKADPLSSPGFSGPLAANPKPMSFDAGPLGQVHVTGQISGHVIRENCCQRVAPSSSEAS